MYRSFFKRLLDFCCALVALLLLSPLLLVVTIWLHFANKGAGAFFLQERPGYKGQSFNLIKFKSMSEARDAGGNLLPDNERLTHAGRFVRKTSLDELPQLVNVLKGDMSLIGPRPLSLVYMSMYTKEQLRRHDVRPGITGWSQVHGRAHLKLSKKFELDVWYVDHCHFMLDLKILFLTIKKVFVRKDVGDGASEMADIDDLHITERMFKYGSDYPVIENYKRGISIVELYPQAHFYALGRQTINDLVRFCKWKRLWVPSYFCYSTLDYIKKSGVELMFYEDYPGNDDNKTVGRLSFEEGDAILRMNYFGLRGFRDESEIQIPVIEDHSHDLVGDWAIRSNADYCIASLRKSLPISEGGILWSPKGLPLPDTPQSQKENEELAERRYKAMLMKRDVLLGKSKDRYVFREMYGETEKSMDLLPISRISDDSWNVVKELDVKDWAERKRMNWQKLRSISNMDVEVILPEQECCYPFSLILMFKTTQERNRVRELLIKRQCVFPAILWNIPDDHCGESFDFGNRMLSIHCDGRYDNDIIELKERIVTAIKLAREE